jgi:hypothetical protein
MKYRLKQSVLVLQHPEVPGLYYDVAGASPRAVPMPLCTMAPASPEYRAQLCTAAAQKLNGTPHEIVRLDA